MRCIFILSRRALILSVAVIGVHFEVFANDQTTGLCSPIIKRVSGNVNVVIKCTQHPFLYKESLEDVITGLVSTFNVMGASQTDILLYDANVYQSAPSITNWEKLKSDARFIDELLKASTEALIAYRLKIQGMPLDDGQALLKRLEERRNYLAFIASEQNPPVASKIKQWLRNYIVSVSQTRENVKELLLRWKMEDVKASLGWPAFGTITTRFDGVTSMGIRLDLVEGSSIYAAGYGTVEQITMTAEGKTVVINRWGDKLVYGNVGSTELKVGDEVKRDAVIAKFDYERTDHNNGLYFAVRPERENKWVDPLPLLGYKESIMKLAN